MKKKSVFFYLGLVSALVLAAACFDIRSLEAVSRQVLLATMPAELRLAEEVGIVSADEIYSGKLGRAMTRREFGLMLKQAMQMLGLGAGGSLKSLKESGVFDVYPSSARLTRKQALEAMCRAVMTLEAQQAIAFDGTPIARFADYAPPAKYAQSFTYLKSRSIVRGYGEDTFGAGRTLRKKEGIYLVFRLYEHVSCQMMNRADSKTLAFVDLARDHPTMKSLEVLQRAGALDLIPLRASFDGNRYIELGTLSAMCQGMLDKAGVRCLLEFEATAREKQSPATRIQLARILEKMAGLGTVRDNIPAGTIMKYADVPADSQDVQVLDKLSWLGIELGYPSGHLMPEEPITWFEVVGCLHALVRAVKFSDLTEPPVEETGTRLLVKQDIEDFANLIRAKRAKIRSILRASPLPEPAPVARN